MKCCVNLLHIKINFITNWHELSKKKMQRCGKNEPQLFHPKFEENTGPQKETPRVSKTLEEC